MGKRRKNSEHRKMPVSVSGFTDEETLDMDVEFKQQDHSNSNGEFNSKQNSSKPKNDKKSKIKTRPVQESKAMDIDLTVLDQNSDEVRFGKNLAHVDKGIRDKTLAALRVWLEQRSTSQMLSDLDLAKIWRGLWFCMWMCDKESIQRELASILSNLVHIFAEDRLDGLRFQASFYETVGREWGQLDYLRMNKFYMLIRYFFREGLKYCLPTQSEDTCIADVEKMTLVMALIGVIRDESLMKLPNGYRLHIADIFLPEVFNAYGSTISTNLLMILLEPWIAILTTGGIPGQGKQSEVLYSRVFDRIFSDLLEYFPNSEEGIRSAKKAKNPSDLMFFTKVEPVVIQGVLFDIASSENIRDKYRKPLYDLIKRYQCVTGIEGSGKEYSTWTPYEPSEWISTFEVIKRASKSLGVHTKLNKYPIKEENDTPKKRKGPPVAGWAAKAIASGEISEKEEDEKSDQFNLKIADSPEIVHRKKNKKQKTLKKLPDMELDPVITPPTEHAIHESNQNTLQQSIKTPVVRIEPVASTFMNQELGDAPNSSNNNNKKPKKALDVSLEPMSSPLKAESEIIAALNSKDEDSSTPEVTINTGSTQKSTDITQKNKKKKKNRNMQSTESSSKNKISSLKSPEIEIPSLPKIGDADFLTASNPSTPWKADGMVANKIGAVTTGLVRKKHVTFGCTRAKEYKKSIRDMLTKPFTPANAAGQPVKGLLKTSAGQSESGGNISKTMGKKLTFTPEDQSLKLAPKTAPRLTTRMKARDFF